MLQALHHRRIRFRASTTPSKNRWGPHGGPVEKYKFPEKREQTTNALKLLKQMLNIERTQYQNIIDLLDNTNNQPF